MRRDTSDFSPSPIHRTAEEMSTQSPFGVSRLPWFSPSRIGLLFSALVVWPWLSTFGPARGRTPARRIRGAGDKAIQAFAFARDGQRIATIQTDGRVALRGASGDGGTASFLEHRGHAVSLAFSPDGRSLASGSADSSGLVWDLTGRQHEGRLAPAKLAPQDLEVTWTDLAGADAAKSYRSLWLLAAAPEQALPLLRPLLRPVAVVPAERLKRLIADLDDDDFEVRERASAELAKLGGSAEGALREALKGQPSAELRQRVQHLLDRPRSAEPSPDRLRQSRALELLERMDTPEARRLLEELAKGAPGAELTRDAEGALERLKKLSANRDRQ
jgi:hypothetical protein